MPQGGQTRRQRVCWRLNSSEEMLEYKYLLILSCRRRTLGEKVIHGGSCALFIEAKLQMMIIFISSAGYFQKEVV